MLSDGAATGCRDDVSRFYTIQEQRWIAVRGRVRALAGALPWRPWEWNTSAL